MKKIHFDPTANSIIAKAMIEGPYGELNVTLKNFNIHLQFKRGIIEIE